MRFVAECMIGRTRVDHLGLNVQEVKREENMGDDAPEQRLRESSARKAAPEGRHANRHWRLDDASVCAVLILELELV